MKYSFFLSYVRADFEREGVRNIYLDWLFKALSETLNENHGRPEGFMDCTHIKHGEEWRQELLDALQSANVLVAILTPSYFASEFCGKEWAVFEQRRRAAAERGGGLPPLILPVLWESRKHLPDPLPEVVEGIQYTHDSYGTAYNENGLVSLKPDKGDTKNEYEEFIGALASRINDIISNHNVAPVDPGCGIDQIRSIFEGVKMPPAPSVDPGSWRPALLMFCAEGNEHWQPFPPDERGIGVLAQGVVNAEKMTSNIFSGEFWEDALNEIEKAYEQGTIVVIFFDPRVIHENSHYAFLQKFDELDRYNCVVVITWSQVARAESFNNTGLQNKLSQALKNKLTARRADCIFEIFGTVGEFQKEVNAAIVSVRNRIMLVARVARPVDLNGSDLSNISGTEGSNG